MSEPVAGHTRPQETPSNSIRHPATTPVPMYVEAPSGKLPTSSVYKPSHVNDVVCAAFKVAEKLQGFPRIGEVLAGNLLFCKETHWTTDPKALEETAVETLRLARLLADPGVQRIAGLLTELKDAS